MKEILLLLGAFLVVSVNANGHAATYYPIESRSRGGSACMIKSRSIEVDEDVPHGKQSSFDLGSFLFPESPDDESDDEYEEEEAGNYDDDYEDDYGDDDDDDLGPAGYPPVPMQYGGGYGPPYPVSSDPMLYDPSFFSDDKEEYKYKRKSGKNKKKKGGNINCIIITKGGHHKHHHGHKKKEPAKLFGIFPMGGNRRSIARGLRALKN